MAETPLVSEVYSYGGTPDIYAKIDGVFELINLKTGSGIYDEHFYQVSSYKELLIEHGNKVDRCRILNIPRSEDESFDEKIFTDTSLYWQMFVTCLVIYDLQKRIRNHKKGD